ncbi:DMSO/selenate family reductase complex A subunit [Marispirochaeta aestuarii]|uniref:DMSO/selenate family reductase complex A subunit n=1 Tax=Marispirochaeta aestuarii TaxID=1963862 RepID=UPI002ABDEEB3|nr:DMSO/selenate family reductase complex A subunit [Marispirochaeta aestuarii]
MEKAERIVSTTGNHNCGGRCLLEVHVQGNRALRITGSKRRFGPEGRQLLPCVRCGSYLKRLYHPDRLKYPLKRIGKRGEGCFERISWDEALDHIAGELKRITGNYGPQSRYIHYATGIMGKLAEKEFFRRLLGIYGGGYLNYYNSYSTACTDYATPYTYGTARTGSSRETLKDSKLIILWGHNPAETIFSTGTLSYLKEAKVRGARVIVVDPRRSDTVKALADQWIPLRPTTDNALMDAMLWVMITEKLYDEGFVRRYCLGFDEGQMPPGIPPGNSLVSYIMGSSDGIPKTPEWAEEICGVPGELIRSFAREYAGAKPAALIQGYGPQRHALGEQPVRGATVLAAVTGNVGISGGWASGAGTFKRFSLASVPVYNPVTASIPVFLWTEAVTRGTSLRSEDGLVGTEKLDSNIKFIASLAGNCLVNQHSDIRRTEAILKDESLCEFILVSEEFLTSSAMYADVLLPSTNFLERIDIAASDTLGEYAIFQNQAVEPEFERRTGYDWIAALADRLGVGEEFSQGRSYEDWARFIVDETRRAELDFPSYERFRKEGIYYPVYEKPHIAFEEQIRDPDKNPFPTPSGKIEIFSERLYRMNRPDDIPAVPKYLPSWEGPEDELTQKYPLQLIGWHSRRSTHSTFANLDRAHATEALAVWINPRDAEERGISDGGLVRVWNDRGTVEIPARVTGDIVQGVAAMPQGGWYLPDQNGVDRGSSINTLTRFKPTPLAKGNSQHTILVEISPSKTPG